jgi:hypothetical protein
VRHRHQPLGAVHRAAAVVAVANLGLAGMDPHPEAHGLRDVPVIGEQRPLCCNRGSDRVVGGREHRVEPVARVVDDKATV